jgi:hypothetical protein
VKRVLPLVSLAILIAATLRAQSAKLPEFHDVYWTHQDGNSTKSDRVIMVFGEAELDVWPDVAPKKQKDPLIIIPYASVTAAEYTFAKSPNVAAGLLISPLFFLAPSKSHWLTIKSASDYTALRLDGGFYRLVLAELEKRTGLTVQSIGENK